jgi:hypothetical protein
MIPDSDNHFIISARVKFSNGKKIELKERPEGNTGIPRCHFFYKNLEDFKIQCRIDWGDLKQNMDSPRLDITITKGGVKYDISEEIHHTSPIQKNGLYIYKWDSKLNELENMVLEFILESDHIRTIRGTSRIIENNNNKTKKSKTYKKQLQKLKDLTK